MLSTIHTIIKKVDGATVADIDDVLATEEPLEIRIEYGDAGSRIQKNISVTMRTPGQDSDLALGFLFTEGIVDSTKSISGIATVADNVVRVSLIAGMYPAISNLERNFYTTSSCGVCGKASIDAIKTFGGNNSSYPYDKLTCAVDVLCRLPDLLRKQQSVFDQTGGIHACALFDTNGKLLLMREDVGRHNALDKLIGSFLLDDLIPADRHILLLSGRASFELVQKAAMAGIKIIAAVGAPSSLAVQMAEEWNITLIGFLRGAQFNIYSGAQRVII